MRNRELIIEIIRKIILEKIPGIKVVSKIQNILDQESSLVEKDKQELFNIIENELIFMHENNIVNFNIKLKEFQAWKRIQN